MPTETFYKLPEVKRLQFIEISIKEFSHNNYELASINKIVKELGIARGSVYQYFTDKLDLWLYLKEYAETIKMQYITQVNRNRFPSFWEYYKQLFMQGIIFDIEQQNCSRFLYRISFKENSNAVLPYLLGWKIKAKEVMKIWIDAEKPYNTFNKELSVEIISHFLITLSISIADLLQERYNVNFDSNIDKDSPLFGNYKQELAMAVNDLVSLFEKALK